MGQFAVKIKQMAERLELNNDKKRYLGKFYIFYIKQMILL
jgi:hypothetical protein